MAKRGEEENQMAELGCKESEKSPVVKRLIHRVKSVVSRTTEH